MTAKDDLLLGNEYPYDASDAWWNCKHDAIPHESEWAWRAARGIMKALRDRRGIKNELNVSEDIRIEIVTAMVEIIQEAAKDKEFQHDRRD